MPGVSKLLGVKAAETFPSGFPFDRDSNRGGDTGRGCCDKPRDEEVRALLFRCQALEAGVAILHLHYFR